MPEFTPEALVAAVRTIFELNHYEVSGPIKIHGAEIDLLAKPRNNPFAAPVYIEATIEYVDNDKYGKDVGKLAMIAAIEPDAQKLIVSSAGFSLPVKERAAATRIQTFTYDELYKRFEQFDSYITTLLTPHSGVGKLIDELARVYEEPVFEDKIGRESATEFLKKWRDNKKHKNNWLVVTGEYGTGKTALTRILQYRWMKDHKANPQLPIPFRIELRNFTRQFDARGLLHNFLDSNGLSHVSIDFVLSLIKSGRVVLLLDGYDEMAQYMNSRERRACLEALADLSSGGAKGIITSRPNYFTVTEELQVFEILYDSLKANATFFSLATDIIEKEKRIDALLLQFIDRYERSLKDLDPSQTEALISKVLASDSEGKSVVLGILKRVFRSHDHGDSLSLSGKPVIVSYLLEIVEGLKKSTDEAHAEKLSEWQIYKMIVKQLMLRDFGRSPELNPADRQKFLQRLAVYLSRRESAFISEPEFKDLVAKEFRRELNRFPADSRHSQLERLFADLRSSGTLTSTNDPSFSGWRFSHNSLREFLLAEHLLEGLLSGHAVQDPVLVTDAMRLFCASMPHSERQRLLDALATEWQRTESRGRSQLLQLLWDALLPEFMDQADPIRVFLARITGHVLECNRAELARLDLSSEVKPTFLERARFASATLSHIQLSHATLAEADFSLAFLESVSFANAVLDSADFTGATIVDCEFSGASVKGASFASVKSEDITIIVATEDNDGDEESLRRWEGEFALGYLSYFGAKTDKVPDYAVYCHSPKFPIVKKILEKLSEQRIRQRMGLEQRGAARADVPFAKRLIQSMEDWGYITPSKQRKDLIEVTDLGRERFSEYTRTGRLPLEIVEFLKAS